MKRGLTTLRLITGNNNGEDRLCKLQKGVHSTHSASDKAYQFLTHGRWFSPGTSAYSTPRTGRHDIAEILLKVALKHQKSIKSNRHKVTSSLFVMLRHFYLRVNHLLEVPNYLFT